MILDGLSPSIFLENRPEFRCIQLTAWKIDSLALLWPESFYLIDPPELKPIGFVLGWLSSLSEISRRPWAQYRLVPGWAAGLKSQTLNRTFSMGAPPRSSWIPQNLNRAIIYWHLSCFLAHSGFRFPWVAVFPPPTWLLRLEFVVAACHHQEYGAPGSGSWPLLLGPALQSIIVFTLFSSKLSVK